jgi:methionine-rich copper-binding protein CopC
MEPRSSPRVLRQSAPPATQQGNAVTIQFKKLLSLNGILGLWVALALASCTAGDGSGLDAGGRPLPPTPPPNDDFQQIQDTIFTPICSTCHAGANAPRGLRLDAGNSFAMIVNVASVEVPGLMRVNPGNPDTSYLVQKIQGNAAVGVRMPANGPPYLTQAQIDLVRGWIAAGAPASAAPADRLVVVSSIPAASEQAGAGLGKLTIIFNGEVDSSRANANAFELRDASDQPVSIAAVRVPPGRQNVVEITTQPLATGSYQLSVQGDGPSPLADQSGHVLDGDADGKPGGDTLIPFDVTATVKEGTAR